MILIKPATIKVIPVPRQHSKPESFFLWLGHIVIGLSQQKAKIVGAHL